MQTIILPPWWKIKREIRLVPLRLSHRFPIPFATTYYDLILSRRRRIHEGAVADTGDDHDPSHKIAIYLIFPTSGVQGSHLSALDYIVRCGYKPLVVSNGFLSEYCCKQLQVRCWRLIERPNFGYDFGGYREGILNLRHTLHTLERLVLLNDSCWFPVGLNANWIHAAEQLGTDLAGAVGSGFKYDLPGKGESSLTKKVAVNRRRWHYCSFALMFSQNVLKDPAFYDFWRGYRLTNNKMATIRRGEIGFSRWIIGNGYSHGATIDISRIEPDLSRLNPEQVLDVVKSCMPCGKRIAELGETKSQLIESFANTDNWKQSALAFLLDCVIASGIPFTLPGFLAAREDYGFLKKSPILEQSSNYDIVFQAATRHKDSCDFDLMDEVTQLGKMHVNSS